MIIRYLNLRNAFQKPFELRAAIRQHWAELDKPGLTPEEGTKIFEAVSVLGAKLGNAIADMK